MPGPNARNGNGDMNQVIANAPASSPLQRMRLLVDALHSGEFPQAHSALCVLNPDGTVRGYCCLGVATEIARRNGLDVTVDNNGTYIGMSDNFSRNYDGEDSALPRRVMEWYGLGSDNPPLRYDGAYHCAIELNDGLRLTLPEIGDAFERTFLAGTGTKTAGPPR